MPVFREYIAKGKLTPSDLGFTAMETAARRQQSFTADQQAAIEKSAKAVGQAWEGSLKFGLDEIELAQQQADKGGGGVKVAGKGSGRTLLGTGAGGDTNWNARANASNSDAVTAKGAAGNVTHAAREGRVERTRSLEKPSAEIVKGTSDIVDLTRDLNGKIAPPVSAADGVLHGRNPQQTIQVPGGTVQVPFNPQAIPYGPMDTNLQALKQFGVNPQKEIIAEPLSNNYAPGQAQRDADRAVGTVPSVYGKETAQTGTMEEFTPGRAVDIADASYGSPEQNFASSGTAIWKRIFDTTKAPSELDPGYMNDAGKTIYQGNKYDSSKGKAGDVLDFPLPKNPGEITPIPVDRSPPPSDASDTDATDTSSSLTDTPLVPPEDMHP